jgi:uncharacterized protein
MKKMIKIIYLIIGSISVVLGIIGIFLPLLPTTPLVLLAAFCFVRSSNKAYQWLLNNRFLGPYIRNYYEKKGIPLKTKVFVLSLLWLSISYSAFVIIDKIYLQIMLMTIATFVTIHILKQKTLKPV